MCAQPDECPHWPATTGAYLPNGRPLSQTDAAGHTTSFTYDVMGRVVSVNAPDTGGNQNITHTRYTPGGQVQATWGDQTYARFHLYDAQNRLTELWTYQGLAHGVEPTLATGNFPRLAGVIENHCSINGLSLR